MTAKILVYRYSNRGIPIASVKWKVIIMLNDMHFQVKTILIARIFAEGKKVCRRTTEFDFFRFTSERHSELLSSATSKIDRGERSRRLKVKLVCESPFANDDI